MIHKPLPDRTPVPGAVPGVDSWPRGWLVLEVANLARRPDYIVMYDEEREAQGLPVSTEDMRAYVRRRREET